MGVEADLFLFGKPAWELDMEEASAEEIRKKGDEIKERLYRIAEIMEKLEQAGWERYSASLYSISFYKEINEEEAREELRRLGIDPEEVSLMEIEEEEEEAEEEAELADVVGEEVEFAEEELEADVGEEWREGERLLLLEDFELPRKVNESGSERVERVESESSESEGREGKRGHMTEE